MRSTNEAQVIAMPRRRPQERRWLSPKEVAQRLSVHIETIYRMPPSVLPFIRIRPGRMRRYLIEDVERYEDASWERGPLDAL